LNSNFPKKYQLLKINDVKEDVEAKKVLKNTLSQTKKFYRKNIFQNFLMSKILTYT
jgi:hypothetical protein